ncbi:hypothetical protein ADMFC3_23610 [Geovibrio sp. ADMFC3]
MLFDYNKYYDRFMTYNSKYNTRIFKRVPRKFKKYLKNHLSFVPKIEIPAKIALVRLKYRIEKRRSGYGFDEESFCPYCGCYETKNIYAPDWDNAYCAYCLRQVIRVDGGHLHVLYDMARARMGEQAYNALPTYDEWLAARGIRPRNIEIAVFRYEGDIFNMPSELHIEEILASDTECYGCPIFTGKCSSFAKKLELKDGIYQRCQECIDSEKKLLY